MTLRKHGGGANASTTATDRFPPTKQAPAKVSFSPSTTAVFAVPVDVVMERQKTKYPDLSVPHVLLSLIDLIKHLNGCKTEGIFRIPGMKQEMELMKRTFDEGDIVEAKNFPNVHTAASVLKLWFRELPSSIIPEDMYYSCLACVSPEEALVCFDAFPLLNKRILLTILQFFKELLQEENVAKTRMDEENICTVFTPSFMRCSSVPASSLLENVEKERVFVHALVSSNNFLLNKYAHLLPTTKEGVGSGVGVSGGGGGGGSVGVSVGGGVGGAGGVVGGAGVVGGSGGGGVVGGTGVVGGSVVGGSVVGSSGGGSIGGGGAGWRSIRPPNSNTGGPSRHHTTLSRTKSDIL